MARQFLTAVLVATALAGIGACSTQSPPPPAQPSTTQPPPDTTVTTVTPLLGVWVPDTGAVPLDLGGADNTADTIDARAACRLIEFNIDRDTDSRAAKIVFAATCANARIRGIGAGVLNDGVLIWKAQGQIALASGRKCAFSFVEGNRAVRIAEGVLKVQYNGTVCDVPVSGTEIVRKKP